MTEPTYCLILSPTEHFVFLLHQGEPVWSLTSLTHVLTEWKDRSFTMDLDQYLPNKRNSADFVPVNVSNQRFIPQCFFSRILKKERQKGMFSRYVPKGLFKALRNLCFYVKCLQPSTLQFLESAVPHSISFKLWMKQQCSLTPPPNLSSCSRDGPPAPEDAMEAHQTAGPSTPCAWTVSKNWFIQVPARKSQDPTPNEILLGTQTASLSPVVKASEEPDPTFRPPSTSDPQPSWSQAPVSPYQAPRTPTSSSTDSCDSPPHTLLTNEALEIPTDRSSDVPQFLIQVAPRSQNLSASVHRRLSRERRLTRPKRSAAGTPYTRPCVPGTYNLIFNDFPPNTLQFKGSDHSIFYKPYFPFS